MPDRISEKSFENQGIDEDQPIWIMGHLPLRKLK